METFAQYIPGLIMTGVVIGVVGLASCPPARLEKGLDNLAANIQRTFERISHAFIKQRTNIKK